MMLNPGQLNPNYGLGHGHQGGWNALGGLGGGAFGPALAAYGGGGFNPFQQGYGAAQQGYGAAQQGFGPAMGPGASAMIGGPIDDAAEDIAERVSTEIADQAATAAAALFQSQIPQQAAQPLSGLHVKRWLNAARATDAVHDSIKQNIHHLVRQTVGHLLGVLQSQSTQQGQQFGQGYAGAAPGLAAFGGTQMPGQPFGGQAFGQQNVAQLAPVVASILSLLQSHAQGMPQFGQFGQAGRLN